MPVQLAHVPVHLSSRPSDGRGFSAVACEMYMDVEVDMNYFMHPWH